LPTAVDVSVYIQDRFYAVILLFYYSSCCGFAVAPLKQEDVLKVCVLHTISKAWSIGRAVERGQRAQQDPIDAILGSVPSKLIFKGRVY